MKILLFVLSLFLGTGSLIAQGIDTSEFVSIGGIKQYLSYKGHDRTKPLLLFLHGGPGNSVISYAHRFTNKLEQHFVVVHWDQRDAGKTLAHNSSPVPLTTALFENDTREVINYLLSRSAHKKLYLVGHSWGTFLGFYAVRNFPELIAAFVAVGPMINQLESERIILEQLKRKAKAGGDSDALAELEKVQIPFQNGEQLLIHRNALMEFTGSKTKLNKQKVLRWSDRWLGVFNEASMSNLFLELPEVKCPVYFMLGRKDYQTNSSLAEQYFKSLIAVKKDLFWFENSAHAVPTSEPARFQSIIIETILPQTLTTESSKPRVAGQH